MRRAIILIVAFSFYGCVATSPNDGDGKTGPPARVTADDGKDNRLPAAAAKILDRAERLEVLSVDPTTRNRPEMVSLDGKPVPPPPDLREDFHGFSVIGKTTVSGYLSRRNLIAAVKQGIADSDGSVAACFIPRHGLRAVADGKTVDLVICYECHSIRVYINDEQAGGVLTAATSRTALDKTLTAAGVALAPR